MIHHFINLEDYSLEVLKSLLSAAHDIKRNRAKYEAAAPLKNKNIALIFEKPSTRTRVSFEVGIRQLGGNPVVLSSSELQLGRGETVADTARVMSRYVDMVMIRCFEHATLDEFAKYGTIPVINGLSNYSHPCQIMADIMTYGEHRGSITGKNIAWVGDCNNVLTSWIEAASIFKFHLRIACPKSLSPDAALLAKAKAKGADIFVTDRKEEAVTDADCVMTDTWISMGETNKEQRLKLLQDYRVTDALMERAKPDAVFMHCLPAHRGKEVTDEVIDGPQSIVWDEAENRLHVQKAIMLWCMGSLGAITADALDLDDF